MRALFAAFRCFRRRHAFARADFRRALSRALAHARASINEAAATRGRRARPREQAPGATRTFDGNPHR